MSVDVYISMDMSTNTLPTYWPTVGWYVNWVSVYCRLRAPIRYMIWYRKIWSYAITKGLHCVISLCASFFEKCVRKCRPCHKNVCYPHNFTLQTHCHTELAYTTTTTASPCPFPSRMCDKAFDFVLLFQILYSHILSLERLPLTAAGAPLKIKCKTFRTVTFVVARERDCADLYELLTEFSNPGKWVHNRHA